MDSDHDLTALLRRYVQGRATDEERAAVEARCIADPGFAAEIEALRLLRDEWFAQLPSDFRAASERSAQRIVRERSRKPKRGAIDRGVLVSDSRDLPLPEGVRPAGVETRRLSFRLNDRQVALSAYPIAVDSFELVGQVLATDEARPYAITLRDQDGSVTTTTDDHGLFRFAHARAGRCTIQLKIGKARPSEIAFEL